MYSSIITSCMQWLLTLICYYSLPSASLPVAKVIPLLTDIAHSVLGDNIIESQVVQVSSYKQCVGNIHHISTFLGAAFTH